jgi:hypothetical protein
MFVAQRLIRVAVHHPGMKRTGIANTIVSPDSSVLAQAAIPFLNDD